MRINNIEIYQRKENIFLKMFSLFKKITTTKRGYLLVNIQPKAYNPKYAQYNKIVE